MLRCRFQQIWVKSSYEVRKPCSIFPLHLLLYPKVGYRCGWILSICVLFVLLCHIPNSQQESCRGSQCFHLNPGLGLTFHIRFHSDAVFAKPMISTNSTNRNGVAKRQYSWCVLRRHYRSNFSCRDGIPLLNPAGSYAGDRAWLKFDLSLRSRLPDDDLFSRYVNH